MKRAALLLGWLLTAACGDAPGQGSASPPAAAAEADADAEAVTDSGGDGAPLADSPAADTLGPDAAPDSAAAPDTSPSDAPAPVDATVQLDGPSDATAAGLANAPCALPVDCTLDAQAPPCHHWTCLAGACALAPDAPGTPCGDAGPCTALLCSAAATCTAPAPKDCPGGPCQIGACDPASGACGWSAAADGAACSDGDPCTQADTCSGGQCAAGLPMPCTATVCMLAACDPATGACAATALPAGATCSDGNPCSLADHCDGQGTCTPGALLACPQAPCQLGQCDPQTGACAWLPSPASACDDGEPCTLGDTCAGGSCLPGAWQCQCQGDGDCDDANPCTAENCAAGTCSALPLTATACDDGDACTLGDHCEAGVCSGAAKPCDDGNACTADACSAAAGACVAVPLSELPCSDGDACSAVDLCAQGACAAGAPKGCADTTPCLAAACNPATGACDSLPLAGPCTPTDACIVGASCLGGGCQGGSPLDCDDGNPCTADSCSKGMCSHLPWPQAQSCGEGQACAGVACTCALGWAAVAPKGDEWLTAAVAAPGGGFAAAGTSDSASTSKGLLIRVDAANQLQWVRRVGGAAFVAFAAVAPHGNGFVVLATRKAAPAATGASDLLWVDAVGNVAGQTPLFAAADGQALAAIPGGGWLVVATEAWAAGAKTLIARVDGAGKPLWQAALAPAQAGHAARAYAAVLVGDHAVLAGQDNALFGPTQSAPWLAAVALGDGATTQPAPLGGLPPGALLGAVALDAGQLIVAGGAVDAQALFNQAFVASAPLAAAPPDASTPLALPAAVTLLTSLGGAGQFVALASGPSGLYAAGWRVQGDSDAVAARWVEGKPLWLNTGKQPGQQILLGAALLGDGSLVGVGQRSVGGTPGAYEAAWLRVAADGATTCP